MVSPAGPVSISAATFRVLSTVEDGLRMLAPGFDIVAEAERFGRTQVAGRLAPGSLKEAAEELTVLLPMLRRLPRRVNRITAAVFCDDPPSPLPVYALPGALNAVLLPHWLPNAGIRLTADGRVLAYAGDTGRGPARL